MKKLIIIIAVAAILVTGLCMLTNHPIILGKSQVSNDFLNAIESQSKGMYSRVLPLVPTFVSIDNITVDSAFYTIRYFPFGAVGMSYREDDGYNIEKPLTKQ